MRDLKGGTLLLVLLLGILAVVYLPGALLFFRNDEWNLIRVIDHTLSQQDATLSAVCHFVIYGDNPKLRHIIPVSLALVIFKYEYFTIQFTNHYLISLAVHLANTWLVYRIAVVLGANAAAALLGATLFGSAALIADTLFWTAQFPYISLTCVTLISICLHPSLSARPPDRRSFVLFYLVTASAPFVLELGYCTLLLAMFFAAVRRPVNARLVITLVGVFMAALGLRISLVSMQGNVHSVGLGKLIANVFVGMSKLFYGMAGGQFNLKITDTLYLLSPALQNPLTILSFCLAALFAFATARQLFARSNPPHLRFCYLSLLIIAALPFAVTSLACDPSNPNPDLSHQMPRYYYLSAPLLAILIAQGVTNLAAAPRLWAICGILLLVANAFAIRGQIRALRPHTDDMRKTMAVFENSGHWPAERKRGPGVDSFRLDWSFNPRTVISFIRLRDRLYLDEPAPFRD
ncbi:MAG: hypothetical protein HY360_00035 [Verrucomicrobia bacterium]|nr:hypothetical protein [Verrucomicrobiota bacterium]